MYFNLETLEFQENISEQDKTYLKEVGCEYKKGSKVMALVTNGSEPLHLHNDEFCSVEDEKVAIRKFRNQDITFLEHIDFFTSKNPRIENPIINDFV